jgi:NADH-quinone oxidoreductase subunit N
MESFGNVESIRYFIPELILSGAMLLVLIADLIARGRSRALVVGLTVAALGAATAAAIRLYGAGTALLFTDMIAIDPFAVYFKLLFYVSTALVVIVTTYSPDTRKVDLGEFCALMLAVAVGMSIMASSVDLLMMVIGLETVSVTSYILAGFLKGNRRSSEAALKYVLYGAASSGVMIYGMSILFGLTGSTNVFEIAAALAHQPPYPLATLVAIGFVLAGIGYKISSVPFHFWTPDVYEGAPIPVTAFLSVGPKAAGFAMMVRFFYSGLAEAGADGRFLPVAGLDWPTLLAALAAATMTFGNLAAIPQTNLKRLLAYSTIAHAGYMLMGFVVLSEQGVLAVLFYLGVYLLMNLGAFFVVITMARQARGEDILHYRGLVWRSPFLAVAMAAFLFSLIGVPPSGGFIGKLYLFAAVIEEKVYWLAVVGVLNAVISLYYYARILKAMFFDHAETDAPLVVPAGAAVLIAVLLVPTVGLGLWWTPLWDLAAHSLAFVTP